MNIYLVKHVFFFINHVEEKGPHAEADKFRGDLWGSPGNSET